MELTAGYQLSREICYLITDGNLKRNLPKFSPDSRRTNAKMTNLGCPYNFMLACGNQK